jgi:hypothetical protein
MTDAGYEFMTDAIIAACENNTISSNPDGGKGYRARYR